MLKSTITTKGQVTIPKEIREYLDLLVGDNLLFTINLGGEVLIVNERKMEVCPVCGGDRRLREIECIVCNSRGTIPIERDSSVLQLMGVPNRLKKQYNISLKPVFSKEMLLSEEYLEVGEGLFFEIVSDKIPEDILFKFNRYFENEFNKEKDNGVYNTLKSG